MPRDNSDRVVWGARANSPFLGERMLAACVREQSVVLLELLPEDLKIEVERLSPIQAVKMARALALVFARAHTRQMDDGQRQA